MEQCTIDFKSPVTEELVKLEDRIVKDNTEENGEEEQQPFESITLPPIKVEKVEEDEEQEEEEEEEEFEPSSFLSVSLTTVKDEEEERDEEEDKEEEEEDEEEEEEEEEKEEKPTVVTPLAPGVSKGPLRGLEWPVRVAGAGGARAVCSGVWVPRVALEGEPAGAAAEQPKPKGQSAAGKGGDENGARPFSCDICAKSFTQKYTLKMHRRLHTEGMPFRCRACPASFEEAAALRAHVADHKAQRLFCCEVCGASFIQRGELNIHMRSHSDARPHTCDLCGKAYKQAGSLTMHVRAAHTGERPFECGECGAAFLNKNRLQVHMRRHTGERPFECATCGQRFSEASVLKKHARTHSDERPYACEVCGAAFALSDGLRGHMRIHTGERRHRCGDCGRAFTQGGALIRHRRIHTDERPFACSACPKAFRVAYNLREHMKTHLRARQRQMAAMEAGGVKGVGSPAGDASPPAPLPMEAEEAAEDLECPSRRSAAPAHSTEGGRERMEVGVSPERQATPLFDPCTCSEPQDRDFQQEADGSEVCESELLEKVQVKQEREDSSDEEEAPILGFHPQDEMNGDARLLPPMDTAGH